MSSSVGCAPRSSIRAGAPQRNDFEPGRHLYFPPRGPRPTCGVPRRRSAPAIHPDLRNGFFSEFRHFSITDWIGHITVHCCPRTSTCRRQTFDGFPGSRAYFRSWSGNPPPSRPAPLPPQLCWLPGPETHRYRLPSQRRMAYSPGAACGRPSQSSSHLEDALPGRSSRSISRRDAVVALAPPQCRRVAVRAFRPGQRHNVRLGGSFSHGDAVAGDVGLHPSVIGALVENVGETPLRLLSLKPRSLRGDYTGAWMSAHPLDCWRQL